MKILFLGDVVGRRARQEVVAQLPELRRRLNLDFVVVNAENAAGGFGITRKIGAELLAAGADVLTTGNHAFDQRDDIAYFDEETRLLRPANYPPAAPGRGAGIYQDRKGRNILVSNIMGRVFMPPLDDPFAAIDQILNASPMPDTVAAIIVDFHTEASSEQMAMGHYCDGRASLVVGTHTHVPSADVRILAQGTAYQTDAGMCGDYDSVIGMEKSAPLARFITGIASARFSPALGAPSLCGLCVVIDEKTGKALKAAPLIAGGALAPIWPNFGDNEA